MNLPSCLVFAFATTVLGSRLRSTPPKFNLLAAKSKVSMRYESTLVENAIAAMMDNKSSGPGALSTAVKKYARAMTIDEALRAAQPHEDIVNLVKSSNDVLKLNTSAMDKAVAMLNEKERKAQMELDDEKVKWHEFKEMNRAAYDQNQADIVGLSSLLADLERSKVAALAKVATLDRSAEFLENTMTQAKINHDEEKARDIPQLNEKKKDLSKFEYMLVLTKCNLKDVITDEKKEDKKEDKKKALLQRSMSVFMRAARVGSSLASTGIHACAAEGREPTVEFADPRLNETTTSLSPLGQDMLRRVLKASQIVDVNLAATEVLGAGFSYDELDDGDDGEDNRVNLLASQSPVATEPESAAKQGAHCATSEPDCLALHDAFAQLWADMKDVVDELTEKMNLDDQKYKILEDKLNAELAEVTGQKGSVSAAVGEVTSKANQAEEDQSEREKVAKQLEETFKNVKKDMKKRMQEIITEEMCGTTRVRNELVVTTTGVEPTQITDCQVSEWTEGPCSKSCNSGTQTMTRDIIDAPSKYGAACPPLEMTKKCNDIPCPIDCQMTEFSAFSKCTKDCGGGVQTRFRNVVRLPAHGGKPCEALEETQPCNTKSCDGDCVLGDWTQFSPCSQACGGGFSERKKPVVHPTWGEGACPARKSAQRYQKQQCNTFDCAGDEICKSKLDVVFAIDGSGSISERGFDILKTFTQMLSQHFENASYGHEAVHAGVVQFGNGHWNDGVVSDALLVHPLCSDLKNITAAIEGTKFQAGFTNMAQGILKASKLLKYSMRRDAESVMIMITDGKPSFKHQTVQAMEMFRKHARVVIVHVKAFPNVLQENLMRRFASKPAGGSYIKIPGKRQLKRDYHHYVTEVLSHSCPQAESVERTKLLAKAKGFKLAFEGMTCLDNATATSSEDSVSSCASRANKIGKWTTLEFEEPPSAKNAPVIPGAALPAGPCKVFLKNCTKYKFSNVVNVYGPPPE